MGDTCRKGLPQQSAFGPLDCERWLKDQGALVGCGKEGARAKTHRPITVLISNDKAEHKTDFGFVGGEAEKHHWHNAIEWAAPHFDLPLPWRVTGEPPCPCPACVEARNEELWSEPVEEMDGDRCREVAKQLGGGVDAIFVGDRWRTIWWTTGVQLHNGASGFVTYSEAAQVALAALSMTLDCYQARGADIYIWLGDLDAMPLREEEKGTDGDGKDGCCHSTITRLVHPADALPEGERYPLSEEPAWLCVSCHKRWDLSDASPAEEQAALIVELAELRRAIGWLATKRLKVWMGHATGWTAKFALPGSVTWLAEDLLNQMRTLGRRLDEKANDEGASRP